MMGAVLGVEAWIYIKFLVLAHMHDHGWLQRLILLKHFELRA